MSERVLIGSIKVTNGRVMIVDPAHIQCDPDFWKHDIDAVERMRESGDFEFSYSGACAAVPARSAAMLGRFAVVCSAGLSEGEHEVYVTIEKNGTVSKMEIVFG